jgi:hypothetical protein
MKLILEEGFDLIDTSESFYKEYLLKDNNLLIPYVNLTLMRGHPLNNLLNVVLLNYGYLVFRGVVLIKKHDRWIYDDTEFKSGKYEFLDIGGTNLNSGIYEELKILYEEGYLQIDERASIASEFWKPIDTPNSKANLNAEEIENFFDFKDLPKDLKQIF